MKTNSLKVKKQIAIILCILNIITIPFIPLNAYASKNDQEPHRVIDFSIGEDSAAAVLEDGSLWKWGVDADGTYDLLPCKIAEDVLSVENGGFAFIKRDGSLWMWGYNGHYCCGLGDVSDVIEQPQLVTDNVAQFISSGGTGSAAIKKDGSLWLWGTFFDSNNNTIVIKKPKYYLDNVEQFQFNTDGNLFAAVKTDGSLWMWGDNTYGSLGTGDEISRDSPTWIMDGVKQLELEVMTVGVVKEDNSYWAWGRNNYFNSYYLLGDGSSFLYVNAPTHIMDNVTQIEYEYTCAAAIKDDGSLWVWGYSYSSSLGPTGLIRRPRQVVTEDSNPIENVMDISFGNTGAGDGRVTVGTLILLSDGTVWATGDRVYGNNTSYYPTLVKEVAEPAKTISVSSTPSVVTFDGGLYIWGFNETGLVGNGTNEYCSVPYKVEFTDASSSEPGETEEEYDAWSFRNGIAEPFSPGWNGGQGYFVTKDDYEKFTSNLPAAEKQKISFAQGDAWLQYLANSGKSFDDAEEIDKPYFNIDGKSSFYRKWAGSCAGMSMWTALVDNEVLSATDLPGAPDSLESASMDDDIASAINFYQGQQLLDYYSNYRTLFIDMSSEDQVSLFEELIGYGSSGAQSVLIDVSWYYLSDVDDSEGVKDGASSHAHAIIGYDLERGDFTSEAQEAFDSDRDSLGDTEFTSRVKLYDPNKDVDYLYFNDDGVWCLPSSSSKSRIIARDGKKPASKTNNGYFRLITPVGESQNLIDYRTGEVSESAVEASEYNYLTYDPDYRLSIEWENNHHVVITHTVADPAFDTVDIFVPTDDEAESDNPDIAEATAVLPEAGSYAVDSMNNRVDYRLSTGGYYLVAASEASGTANFGTSGSISVSLDKPGVAYLNVTANEGHTTLPWPTIEVVAEDASEVSAQLTEDGMLVTGDALDGSTVYGSKDDKTEVITLNTNEEAVLLAEDGDGALAAFVDRDGDGTYETNLDEAASAPVELTSANITPVPDQAWTGNPVCPKPVVTVDGATLVEGADYACSYENNVSPGMATLIVSGQGAYTGTVKVEFRIVRDGADAPDHPTGPSGPGATDPDDSDTPEPEQPWDNPFTDVAETDWFYGAVRDVYDMGIMQGYDDGSGRFGSLDVLTREQAAAVLFNYLGEGDRTSPEAPHADVVQGQWYSAAVNWSVANEVMRGYGGDVDTFGVGDSLTREQFAAIIANVVKADVSSSDASELESFPDSSGVSEWAERVMAWAVESGVIRGFKLPDGSRELRATAGITRAEMAAMVMNAIDAGVL